MQQLDRIDRRILIELMADATVPLARLAERVGLSQTPCWKRVRKLEAAGIITGRVALVDPSRIGLPLTAFVGIGAPDQSTAWHAAFGKALETIPEVVEAHRMAGELDYMLRVVVSDMAAFDEVRRRLTELVPIRSLTAQFALERVKAARGYAVSLN